MSTGRKRPRGEVGSPAGDGSPRGRHDAFFAWLLGTTQREFFRHYFEKKPLHFSHGAATHFTEPHAALPAVRWSTELMLRLAAEKSLSHATDVSVVRFDAAHKKRISFRSQGTVTEEEMRCCMRKGWSVRFLRPQEYVAENSAVLVLLEEIFGCFCGLNSYWTPANSQGFAPHYDDVDVFLLQLEGEKEWRLYDPPATVDVLSRHSSEDYAPEQLPKPKQTLRLVAGDVLYMPRGTVHQGRTYSHAHSLHVTFSANQMNAWADLMKHAVTHVVEKLAANQIHWRRSLSRLLPKAMGAVHHPVLRAEAGLPPLTEQRQKRRRRLQSTFQQMAADVFHHLCSEEVMDECCDMYVRETVAKQQPLPPSSVCGAQRKAPVGINSIVRPRAPHCARLVLAFAGEARVYHCCGNSPVCLAAPEGLLRFEADFAPAIATILAAPERGVRVSDLPFTAFDKVDDVRANQLTLVEALRDAGILAVL
ncbi:lysine-specific demethylase NO66 [Trypanosoma conorhini]|uniref:Bifunctional lysine-specific demethylase and histidyl-hydroxylase n=1 Tax=Trypanosoma conorhini TaxID=83891 RepID=A0A3R7PJT6_9TRYP|nr:lysine-specific demethylase NO66 [Trypanosoma conorhini]RNF26376.1 lysine-specific demethylase NO66 [Trypanosoma conorhini]